MNAASRRPEINAAYDAGLADGRRYIEQAASWQPNSSDIEKVEALAAKGYGPVEVAGVLKVSRAAFMHRLEDTPQLRQALEQGEGRYRTALIEDSEQLLAERDPGLRYISQLLLFKLKAHCGLSDRDKPILIEGKVEHTYRLNANQPVGIKDISEFARIEMERANKLNAEKLKAIGIIREIESTAVEVIEGELEGGNGRH